MNNTKLFAFFLILNNHVCVANKDAISWQNVVWLFCWLLHLNYSFYEVQNVQVTQIFRCLTSQRSRFELHWWKQLFQRRSRRQISCESVACGWSKVPLLLNLVWREDCWKRRETHPINQPNNKSPNTHTDRGIIAVNVLNRPPTQIISLSLTSTVFRPFNSRIKFSMED